MELRPLGKIITCFPTKFGVPRQGSVAPSSWGLLTLEKHWPEELFQDLESMSHVWLIFGFHLNRDKTLHAKVHPPRLGGGKKVGALSTRTPHRPNPLGLSLAKVESCQGRVLKLSGVDLVSGTPIYDVKPYVDAYDRPSVESRAGWVEVAAPRLFPVVFLDSVLELYRQLPERLQKLIVEIVQSDPRPETFRTGRVEHQNKPFGVYLDDYDIHFRGIQTDTGLALEIFQIVRCHGNYSGGRLSDDY